MNAAEIKKAWNAFKKEVAKEVSFSVSGSCYMNKKQIENRTATILICNDIEYDDEIKYYRASIERVNGYDSWTDEEKKRNEESQLAEISKNEALKAAYGNKACEAREKAAEIQNSKAYGKLVEAIGISHFEVELVKKWEGLSCYQIRVYY